MTPRPMFLREHFYSVVYLAWLVSLLSFIVSGSYRAFIRPSFVYFLWAALLILIAFILSGLNIKKYHGVKLADVVRGGILLLPLAALWLSYGKPLGTHAFLKKNVNPRSVSSVLHDNSSIYSDQIGQSSNIGQQAPSVTILELIKTPDKYHGKLVTIEGMALRQETYNREAMQGANVLPPASFILFRFKIVCCVADSQSLGVIVETPVAPDVVDNGWYRVTGRFMLNKEKIGVISQAVVTDLDAPPDQPYLYENIKPR